MRRRLIALHASVLFGMVAVAACFPDPPTDTGIPDSGIFLSDGSISPTDDSSVSGLTLSSLTVDFGLNECGGVAPPNQKLTLTNTSSGPVSFGVAASGNQFAVVSSPTGTIPAGQSTDVTIASLGVSTFATAGGIVEGALQVVTDAPGQKLFVVDLRETAKGGALVLIPSTQDFGLVAEGTTADGQVGFRNNGNSPIEIDFGQSEFPFVFTFDTPDGGSLTIPANSTVNVHATYSPDAMTFEDSGDSAFIPFTTTSLLCGGGEAPSSVTLRGGGGYADGPSITPGVLTFDVGGTGYVPCGTTATAKTVTVVNPALTEYGSMHITQTNVTGPFTVSPTVDTSDEGGEGIAVPAGANQVFTITPQTITAPQSTAPGAASGQLEIDLDNEEFLIVQLSQTAQGAVLAFAPPSIDFGAAPLDFPTMQLLGITNSGNAAVGLTLGVTGSPYFTASPSSQFSVNTPGGASTVTFLPIAAGAAQGQIALTASGPVCGLPSPSTVLLTGNGSADAGIPDSGIIVVPDSGTIIDSGVIGDDSGVQ